MKLEQFSWLVKQIPYGKKLPTAVYLAPTNPSLLPKELVDTIQRAEVAAKPDSAWNLLKLHTDQLAITFLSYPDFEDDPHPALAEATKINLNTGTVVRTDYRQRTNPPILHRKETFLPPGHPRAAEYAALTAAEEQAGLYRDPSRIGLRLYWQALLSDFSSPMTGTDWSDLKTAPQQWPRTKKRRPRWLGIVPLSNATTYRSR